MTLQNLSRIGRLKPHEPTPAEVQRLLAAIERNVADAAVDVVAVEVYRFQDLAELVGPEDVIDLGNLLLDIGAIPLSQAACNHQPFAVALSFQFRHLQNRVDGFLLGRVDEAAGIHHDDVGIGGMRRQFMAV